jgi:hypothetical protein
MLRSKRLSKPAGQTAEHGQTGVPTGYCCPPSLNSHDSHDFAQDREFSHRNFRIRIQQIASKLPANPPNWSIDRSSYAKFRSIISHDHFRIISHHFASQACMASPTAHASGMPQPQEAVPEPEAQIALLDQSFESVQHPAPTDAVPNRINVAPETSGASPRTCTLHAHLHVHIARSHTHTYTCVLHAHAY